MSEETQTQSEELRIVHFNDGNTIDFGSRAKVITTFSYTENSFTVNFYIVDGRMLSYSYNSEQPLNRFLVEMAAFGAASKAKGSVAGLELDEIYTVLVKKIEEFNNEVFISRGSGSTSTVLTLEQEAYATINGIDLSNVENILVVKDIFENMSEDDKKAFRTSKEVKLAIAKIRLARLEAEFA